MPDAGDKLRATLKELESELSSADSLDDQTREQLADAVAAIAASIRRGQRSQESQQAENSLQDRLTDFEASHPQIAILVGRLLDGLAQLGI